MAIWSASDNMRLSSGGVNCMHIVKPSTVFKRFCMFSFHLSDFEYHSFVFCWYLLMQLARMGNVKQKKRR